MANTKQKWHVEQNGSGRWQVRNDNVKRATAIFPTQKAAIESARSISKHRDAEIVIHRRDGQISVRSSQPGGVKITKQKSVVTKTIRYATDAAADKAAEKVFRLHDRLLAELAK